MDETKTSTPTGRTYDSSGRRRAAEQRHQHVAKVAAEVFASRGWVGTTLPGVAEAAGVSPELVRRTFGGKAGLLMAARLANFDQDLDLRQLLAGLHLEQEPDREKRLDAIVELACRILVPMAPLVPVLLHAAMQDDRVKTLYEGAQVTFWHTAQDVVELLAPSPVPPDAVDEVNVMLLAETYLHFTRDLGWSTERYAAWLRRTLTRIVAPESGDLRPPGPR